MGISTNSQVAFICANDETAWAQPYIDELKVPTTGKVGGFSSINVNGAGFWDAVEEDISVPVRICEVLDDGKTIIMSSDYYGLLNPARMDLPVSLQAVVYASDSCQNEPQDPIYAVRAENVRLHNFSDTSEINRPAWFNFDEISSKTANFLEGASYDEENDVERFDHYVVWEKAQEALRQSRIDAFPELIKYVQTLENLIAPFIETPELATVMGYLKSVDHEEADEELGYSWENVPQYPSWEYTNEEIIYQTNASYGFKQFPAEIQEILNNAAKVAAEEKEERRKYFESFTPKKTGLIREEYAAAYKAALAGAEDVTGAVNAIQSLGIPETSEKRIKGYVLERIESLTSPVGQKLIDAKRGEEVKELVWGIYQKGRWNRFKLEGEEIVEETVDNDTFFRDALANCQFEEIFNKAEELKEQILGSIDEIASNFTEDNEYAASGEEPQWLLTALLKAGAEFGSGGGFTPQAVNTSIADSEADYIAGLVQRGLDGLEGSGWLSGHQYVASKLFLSEAWDSDMEEALSNFAQFVHEREVTEDEYLDAGKPVIEKYISRLKANETRKDTLQWALDVLSEHFDGDITFKSLSLAYIKRHPEYRDALWEMLFDGKYGSENWEQLLKGEWFAEFKDKVELSAKIIDAEWAPYEEGGVVDYSSFGAEVAEVFKRALGQSDASNVDATFKGKRVCITGKLGETREVWEAWVKDAGGTVASGVSKTTDYLIAGEDAGNKLGKAEELGVTVLNEEQAKDILDYVCKKIQKNWAALIIDKLTKELPADTTDGYFKITDSAEVQIEVGASVADIKTWLAEHIGVESVNEHYVEPEEVDAIQIEWIAADQVNNVSVWYYDDEFGQIDKPSVKTLNTMDDVLLWAHNKDSGLGGHLSCIRVVTKAGDQKKSEYAGTLGFPTGIEVYLADILENHEDDPDLVEAMGGAEVVQKCFDEKDYSRLREVLGQGLWPKQKS